MASKRIKLIEGEQYGRQRMQFLMSFKGQKTGSFFLKEEKDVVEQINESLIKDGLSIIDNELKKLD
jgi:hypothetical protein